VKQAKSFKHVPGQGDVYAARALLACRGWCDRDGSSRAFSTGPRSWQHHEEQGQGSGRQQQQGDDDGQMDNTDLAVGIGAIVAAAGFGYFVHSMTSGRSDDQKVNVNLLQLYANFEMKRFGFEKKIFQQ
jgi:hypothetical protein